MPPTRCSPLTPFSLFFLLVSFSCFPVFHDLSNNVLCDIKNVIHPHHCCPLCCTFPERAARRNDAPVITKVIGSSTLPASLVDTAHLSILNYPADEDGMVTQVTLRLGGHAPGHGDDWEVRIYEKTETRSFILKGKQSIAVSTRKTSEQTMQVHPPLAIQRGQFIGLVNKSGRLSLTYTRGWSMQRGLQGDLWDLW